MRRGPLVELTWNDPLVFLIIFQQKHLKILKQFTFKIKLHTTERLGKTCISF